MISRTVHPLVSYTVLSVSLLCGIWAVSPRVFMISDGIAQFMPVAVLTSRHLLQFELPLFNFFQLGGVPILELGYYPALYPPTVVSYVIARWVFNDPQRLWDVLVSLQIFLNGAAALLLFTRGLKVPAWLAVCGSIAFAFSGIALFQGAEWFYSLVCFGAIALIMYLAIELSRRPSVLQSLLLALAFGVFYLSTNFQYFFYSLHVLLPVLLWACTSRPQQLRKSLTYFLLSGGVSCVLIVPFLLATQQYSTDSIREAGIVSLDKYYWLTTNWRSVLSCSALPCDGLEPGDALRPLYSNFIGSLTGIGILLLPVSAGILLWQRCFSTVVLMAILCLTTAFTYLMSFGPDGGIAPVLYHVPPYGWFRHSMKWSSIAQPAAIILSVLSLGELLRRSPRANQLSRIPGFLTAVVPLLYVVMLLKTTPPRFTEATLPIPQPSILNQAYRHHSLWHRGKDYETEMPKFLMAHNYASLWEIPAFLGYEPQMRKANMALANGNFFRGFDYDADHAFLMQWIEWGVRYLRVPAVQLDQIMATFRGRFPKLQMRAHREEPVSTIEFPTARRIIFGKAMQIEKLHIGTSAVSAMVTTKGDTLLTFNWLANPRFEILVDNTRVASAVDGEGRPTILVPQGTNIHIELRYRHRLLEYLAPVLWLGTLAVVGWCVSARRICRQRSTDPLPAAI